MKILLSTLSFAEGGVSKALIEILEILDRNNIDYDILVEKKEGPFLAYIPSEKITQIEFDSPYIKRLVEGFYNRSKISNILDFFLIAFAKLINKTFSINIIYNIAIPHVIPVADIYDYVVDFHGYGIFSTYYLAAHFKNGIKYSWIHDERGVFLKLVKYVLRKYDAVCCVSTACAKRVNQIIPQIKKCKIVHNIINKQDLINRGDAFEINNDRKMLLSIGRLEAQKGFDIIPKVAKKLVDSGCEFVWYIIGDGSLKLELNNDIKRNNLSAYVKLLGFMENPMPYLKNCYLYIQPSLHEGYPTTISEALILKKVIVATKIPSMVEAVQKINEELLIDRTEDKFFEVIYKLLNDSDLYAHYCNNLNKKEINCYESEFLNLLKEKNE